VTVTTFSTASRAHLRRAGPLGLNIAEQPREAGASIEGEMNGQSDPPLAAGVRSEETLLAGGSFRRALRAEALQARRAAAPGGPR